MLKRNAACAALIVIAPVLAQAVDFTVDSTADDSSPGTLRWAIDQHAANIGTPNTIQFDVSLAGQTILFTDPGVSGHLEFINGGTLTIDGSAAPGLTIDRNGGSRIFLVNNDAELTLRHLTLTGASGPFGGACLRSNDSTADIVLDHMVFDGCESNSTSGGDGLGGAVQVIFDLSGGSLTVTESLFSGNRVFGSSNLVLGGAIFAENGTLTIERSRFQFNSADAGGSAFHQGGAVFANGVDTVTVREAIFFANQAADGNGGALALDLSFGDAALLEGNLLTANVAEIGAALWTGGLSAGDQPDFDLAQNTFVSNTSASAGGAIYFRQGDVRLRNNSFVDNVNLAGGGAHIAYLPDTVTYPSVWNNAFGPAGSDACGTFNNDPPSAFPSAGFNLLPDSSCAINGTGDIIDSSAGYLPAGAYGGPTLTVPPDPDNPAVDGGNPAAPDNGDMTTCPETDARGEARPADGDLDATPTCDIGAFEWQHEAAVFLDGYEAGLVIP